MPHALAMLQGELHIITTLNVKTFRSFFEPLQVGLIKSSKSIFDSWTLVCDAFSAAHVPLQSNETMLIIGCYAL